MVGAVIPNAVDFLDELRVDDRGVEVKEDGERQGDSLDDDPRHDSEEVGLVETCPDL